MIVLLPPLDDFGFIEGDLPPLALLVIRKPFSHSPTESPCGDLEKGSRLLEIQDFHLVLLKYV